VRFRAAYRELYDQAGLMLRIDSENWIKTGVEFYESRPHISAVVTRQFSDWSVRKLEATAGELEVYLRVVRKNETVEIHFSLDGNRYEMVRMAYLVPSATTMVGPMAASPVGPGLNVTFEDFRVEPLP